jgi:hypothetical protein
MEQILHEKVIGTQLAKEFPFLYGNWSFINVFTRTRNWVLLSQMNPVNKLIVKTLI